MSSRLHRPRLNEAEYQLIISSLRCRAKGGGLSKKGRERATNLADRLLERKRGNPNMILRGANKAP